MSVCPLTRRELFHWCGAASLMALLVETKSASQSLTAATTAVDHLLLGTADLDRGIAWVEQRTGVRAIVGGSHPGAGTRNALISLGGRRYLEVIAPDPAQGTYGSRFEVRALAEPRLIAWAAAASDIDRLAEKFRLAGRTVLGPTDGSRVRPDGAVLEWKTLAVSGDLGNGGVEPLPFFIQWSAGSRHPSADSPVGCTLKSLEFVHPTPDALVSALQQLGIEAAVSKGTEVAMRAVLDTPAGRVHLS